MKFTEINDRVDLIEYIMYLLDKEHLASHSFAEGVFHNDAGKTCTTRHLTMVFHVKDDTITLLHLYYQVHEKMSYVPWITVTNYDNQAYLNLALANNDSYSAGVDSMVAERMFTALEDKLGFPL